MLKLIHPKTGVVREVPKTYQNKINILKRAGFVNFDSYRAPKRKEVVPDATVSDVVQDHKLEAPDSEEAPEAEAAIHVSAPARAMIKKNDLDPALIKGSGKDGSITKPDVKAYLEALKETKAEKVESAVIDAVNIVTHDEVDDEAETVIAEEVAEVVEEETEKESEEEPIEEEADPEVPADPEAVKEQYETEPE